MNIVKEDITGIFIGLLVTFFLGLLTKPVLHCATDADKPAPPKGMEQSVWDEIVSRGSGGKWVGWLEPMWLWPGGLHSKLLQNGKLGGILFSFRKN